MGSLSRQLVRSWFSHKEILFNISSATEKSWPRYSSTKPVSLKYIIKKVEPFGKVVVNLPGDVEIKTVDPHKYSDVSTLIVNVYSTNEKTSKVDSIDDIIKVNISSDICEIKSGDIDIIPSGIKCLIESPPRYDVEVKTTGEGNVNISGMVSDTINIQTEFGNINTSKLQGQTISLSSSEGGSVSLKNNIQGNIEINTAKDGTVDADKFMGTKLDISTENGDVTIGSNYCEKATFTTANGNLNLNNLHMDSSIDISGNGTLNISCLDGSLKANIGEGDSVIQIVRITGDSLIKSSGNVSLKIAEDNESQLLLQAQNFDIDKTLNIEYSEDKKELIIGKNGNKLKVEAEKNIQVTRASWMDCLNLRKSSA